MITHRVAFKETEPSGNLIVGGDNSICAELRKYLNVTGKEASIIFNDCENTREIIVLINDQTIEGRIPGIEAWLGFPVKIVQWYLWRPSS